jgi:putative nucleotidyltransferase with HDIG domain
VAGPLARLVEHLRTSESTGLLPEVPARLGTVQEIRDLCESFNRAAASVRDSRENLHAAYVEFVESLASALDARDPYTAGHSRRVSEYACAIARALNYTAADLEEIRVAALLHDIGKIGIADAVLQKPGKLTEEEFAIIREHPTIGRRILEGVRGFHPYLPVVELHHEDWDGSGYPHGLKGEATPLSARIVHVADAYDAMTSDRPYRRGMGQERALRILAENAGTQFDATAVAAFLAIVKRDAEDSGSIARLAAAVAAESAEKTV